MGSQNFSTQTLFLILGSDVSVMTQLILSFSLGSAADVCVFATLLKVLQLGETNWRFQTSCVPRANQSLG